MKTFDRLLSIMSGEDQTVAGRLSRAALACLEAAYRALVAVRNTSFATGLRPRRRLGPATISVGNLTTGGTGKTPMVIDLAGRLLAKNVRPAVLLRGYHSGLSGSDEANLIRQVLGPTVPVECGRNRLGAAKHAEAKNPNIEVFLLDDAFQHRQIHRDLDLVLVDATRPFGFGHVLPRGLLREPIKNLRRADAVVVTRADQITPAGLWELDDKIHRLTGQRPIAHTTHQWQALVDVAGQTHGLDLLSGSPVVGVCGIGNPEPFHRTLKNHVGQLIATHTLPDHYRYDRRVLGSLLDTAHASGAQAVVTTQKDMVKWQPLLSKDPGAVPVYYPALGLFYLDGQEAIESLLRATVCPSGSPAGHAAADRSSR